MKAERSRLFCGPHLNLRQVHLSPSYTTKLDDLLQVKAI